MKFLNWDSVPDSNWHKQRKRTALTVSIILSNESEIHERVRVKLFTAVADLGGLYALLMAIFSVFYWFFVEPYRDLHLAVSFNKMKN